MRLVVPRILSACAAFAVLGGCVGGAPGDAGRAETAAANAAFGPVSLREAITGGAEPRAEPVAESAPRRPPTLAEAAAGMAASAPDLHAAPTPGPASAAYAETAPRDAGGAAEAATSDLEPVGVLFAVHLASYRSEDTARRGWDALSFQPALAGLEPRVERVDLGAGKGVFLRLKAGPLPNRAAAESRCAALIAEGLYCAVETHAGKALP